MSIRRTVNSDIPTDARRIKIGRPDRGPRRRGVQERRDRPAKIHNSGINIYVLPKEHLPAIIDHTTVAKICHANVRASVTVFPVYIEKCALKYYFIRPIGYCRARRCADENARRCLSR